ncbi:MAG: DUF2141 domain-containing protein [Cyclobacteriaceae bacterium]
MLYNIIQAKLLFLLVLLLTGLESQGQSTLRIKVSDIETNRGKVIVALFQDEENWLEQPYQEIILATDKDFGTAEFDVPFGQYAVSIYQDLNTNSELDRNFLGIPKEPVGFGNNHKPFGSPKFESSLINHSATSAPQEIKLYEVL